MSRGSESKQSSEGFCINKPHPQFEFLRNHVVHISYNTARYQNQENSNLTKISPHFSGVLVNHTLKGLGVENVGVDGNQLVSEK